MASHADTPDRGDNIERSYSPEPLSAVEEGSAAVVGKAKERDGPSSESESRRNRSEAFNTRSLPPLGDGVSRLPGGGGKGTKKTKFIYGNYHRYYGYRVGNHISQDTRVKWMRREWFQGKACLDIGCNEGALTIHIAKEYGVRKMVGIDIDRQLIFEARKRLRQVSRAQQASWVSPAQSRPSTPSGASSRFKREVEGSCPASPASRSGTECDNLDLKAEPAVGSSEHPSPVSQPNKSNTHAEPGIPSLERPSPGSGLNVLSIEADPGVASAKHPSPATRLNHPCRKTEADCASTERLSLATRPAGSGIEAEAVLALRESLVPASWLDGSGVKAEPGTASAQRPSSVSGAAGGNHSLSVSGNLHGAILPDPPSNMRAEPDTAATTERAPALGLAVNGRPEASPTVSSNLQDRWNRAEDEALEAADRHSGGGARGAEMEGSQWSMPSLAQDEEMTEESSWPSGCTWEAPLGAGPALEDKVHFLPGNVLAAPIDPETYDTVTCLSVTKWVHLNWGDKGLINLFRKIYSALRQGGLLLLEPQPWKSYTRNRGVSKIAQKHYNEITLHPEDFRELLLDKIGFQQCTLITESVDPKKGFGRPLYLLKK